LLGPFVDQVFPFSLQEFFIFGVKVLQKAEDKICTVHVFTGFQFQGGGSVFDAFGKASVVEVYSYSHDDGGSVAGFGDAFT